MSRRPERRYNLSFDGLPSERIEHTGLTLQVAFALWSLEQRRGRNPRLTMTRCQDRSLLTFGKDGSFSMGVFHRLNSTEIIETEDGRFLAKIEHAPKEPSRIMHGTTE